MTQSHLSSITFSKYEIAKMIQNLDPNKAYGHDWIIIGILKLCSASICNPLEIVSNRCLEMVTFPNDWKKGNVFPVFKKGEKKFSKTTIRSRHVLCVVKYLRNYSTRCSNFSFKTINFRLIILVFNLEIPL